MPLGSGGQADCWAKTPADKVTALRVRQYAIYPWRAPSWTDLRVGFFLSVSKAGDLTNVTGLDETIGADDRTPMDSSEYYWIGLKNANDIMPGGAANVGFYGFSNRSAGGVALGRSMLSGSDAGTGAGSQYWWPHNGKDQTLSACIFDGRTTLARSPAGMQQHFPQNLVGGYALMLGLRLLRPKPDSKLITMQIKTTGGNADLGYSDTPTKEICLSYLQAWPPAMQIGPVEMLNMPNALYFYWPFHNSRLRIHSVAVVKGDTVQG